MSAVLSVNIGGTAANSYVGTDMTNYILMETFTAEAGSRDSITTCSFDIRDETKTIDIKAGALVIVRSTVTISGTSQTTAIWRGYVGNITWAFDGAASLITVDCQSSNCLLDQKAYRTRLSERVGLVRTRGSDIQWLLSSTPASEGFSQIIYNAAKIHRVSDANLPTIKYGGKTLRQALERFCLKAYDNKMVFWVDVLGELNVQRVGASVNLIQNSGFQLPNIQPTAASSTATDWTFTANTSRNTIAGQNSDSGGAPTLGEDYDYGLKCDNSTEAATQQVAALAGERYYFSASIKNVSASRAEILLRFRATAGGSYLSPTTTITTTTVGSWVRVEQIVTAPATAAYLEIRLGYSGATTGSVYYDNLQCLREDAPFAVSDTPNNTFTFAPMNYEESLDASAIINAVAIKGAETVKGSNIYTTWYKEFAPSIAYFGKVSGTFIEDSEVTNQAEADRAADAVFSESAMPIREGTYTISSDRLGFIVPTVGTYQLFEMQRMPNARQLTINRIEAYSILPYGNGEIVYEIQFGAQKGSLASALATVGSALVGTAKPRLTATAFSHNMQQSEYVSSGRRLTDPQVTGAAAEVITSSSLPAANTQMSVIRKNTTLTVAQNLPDLTIYASDFPAGTLVLLVPDAGDPHISVPTVYRSDGVSAWGVSSTETIFDDAADMGVVPAGVITADLIFAGSIDANQINVVNLNASEITTGSLTLDGSQGVAITSENFAISASGIVDAKSINVTDSTVAPGIVSSKSAAVGDFAVKDGETVQIGHWLEGATATRTITGVALNTPSAGYTRYTCSNSFVAGSKVDITGCNPETLDLLGGVISARTSTTFTIKIAMTDTYISGGTAVASTAIGTFTTDLAINSNGIFTIGKGTLGSGDVHTVNGTLNADGLQINGVAVGGGSSATSLEIYESDGGGTSRGRIRGSDSVAGRIVVEKTAGVGDVTLYVDGDIETVNSGALSVDGSASALSFTGTTSITAFNASGGGDIALTGADETAPIAGNGQIKAKPNTTALTTNSARWVSAGGGVYNLQRDSSTRRVKTNIVDADDAVLSAAKNLRAVHYEALERNNQGQVVPSGRHTLGLIAEEILEAGLGCAVTYDGEGLPDGYDEKVIIAALLHRVNDLEARLAALEVQP
jgi:hypothetical protein